MPFKTEKIYKLKLKAWRNHDEEAFKGLSKVWREFRYLRTINGNRVRIAIFASTEGGYLETFTDGQLKDHEIKEWIS